jgi:predicted Kef-type K+ transport protein
MSSTVNRPAVDIGPPRARPGLALALALLAIPGSTIAWDLPAGGLWIGVPLVTTALVLGIRARRQHEGVGVATAAIAIGTLVIAQMVVYAAVKALS